MGSGPSLLVDLRVAQSSRERGVPRYCQSLVMALAREYPALDIACLIDSDRDPPLMLEQLASIVQVINGTASIAAEGRRYTHFLQSSMFDPRKSVQALFPAELATHHPRLGAIVYDLIPWLFPEIYLADVGRERDYLRILPALPCLDRVFTISESVRRDVIAIANVRPSRVVTIYGGLDAERWPIDASGAVSHELGDGDPPGALDALGAQGADRPIGNLRFQNDEGEHFSVARPFWLYVGGDDARKNLPRLIEALALVKRRGKLDAPLVVACSIRPASRATLLTQAAAMGLSPGIDVLLTGYVSDETLGTLFSDCLATVFPSLYEGLGLPVLESYLFGKPVLASDSSALRESVPDLCRFDPYRVESIADAMQKLREDPLVAEASLAAATPTISRSTWSAAARKIGLWLHGSREGANVSADARPMWVAASLPPEKTGVAFFTQRSLGAPDRPVTFFAPVSDATGLEPTRHALARVRHDLQREAAPVEILPLATLAGARLALSTQPMLFVLGNSTHHLPTVAHLLTHGARPDDAVHLHDVDIGNMLLRHFGTKEQLRANLLDAYPAHTVDDWLANGGGVQGSAGALLGPRLLVRRAGVRRFIVNSTAAAGLLRRDLAHHTAGVEIETLFLPVQPRTSRPSPQDSERLRIGHFGYLGPSKLPDRLVAACDLLARRRPIELVFAGYGAESYASRHGLLRGYSRLVDSPSDEELEVIMSTVDCAVQLRYPDRGESSGVVNQLLALRRPVVCTRIGAFADMQGVVHLVAPDVDAADLAIAIERAAASGWTAAADAFVAQRSPWVFEARLRELLSLDASAIPDLDREHAR